MPLEAELGRHVLFVRNLDKPGFIGALGHALAAASINIASFHLGRTAAGQDAICLVEVDDEVTPAMLETVRGLPNVIQAKSMRF
jgi:D-3-phosphoglycerate dehydrogenase / 2-oxoglutarate reductase